MELFSIFLWTISTLSIMKCEDGVYAQQTTFDVTKFGAVGDGKTDDTKGFNTAWAAACQSGGDSVELSVPSGKTFLLSPIQFKGPCKSAKITFMIAGSIIAQPKSAWNSSELNGWLRFGGVNGLAVVGNQQGSIDGQGASWWQNPDDPRPVAMLFTGCQNLQISGLKHINSQKFHLSLSHCNNVTISNLLITAPATSPNTDGIDIGGSSNNIIIQNCTIKTGDDCIAVKPGTSNLNISQIVCGPGHGISIGSLGQGGGNDTVEAISVSNCTISGTQNGVRIKTWQGGSGFAKNINFTNIFFDMANNPMVIDQFYCPHKTCANQTSAVEVSDVRFLGLSGTSASAVAISLRCSDAKPCTGIVVDEVNVKSSDARSRASSVCSNAHGIASRITSPPLDCLKK